ncbi:hypothetical protein HDV57DRAFT_137774 [Trichoderma longibrachiatum]
MQHERTRPCRLLYQDITGSGSHVCPSSLSSVRPSCLYGAVHTYRLVHPVRIGGIALPVTDRRLALRRVGSGGIGSRLTSSSLGWAGQGQGRAGQHEQRSNRLQLGSLRACCCCCAGWSPYGKPLAWSFSLSTPDALLLASGFSTELPTELKLMR